MLIIVNTAFIELGESNWDVWGIASICQNTDVTQKLSDECIYKIPDHTPKNFNIAK